MFPWALHHFFSIFVNFFLLILVKKKLPDVRVKGERVEHKRQGAATENVRT